MEVGPRGHKVINCVIEQALKIVPKDLDLELAKKKCMVGRERHTVHESEK